MELRQKPARLKKRKEFFSIVGLAFASNGYSTHLPSGDRGPNPEHTLPHLLLARHCLVYLNVTGESPPQPQVTLSIELDIDKGLERSIHDMHMYMAVPQRKSHPTEDFHLRSGP